MKTFQYISIGTMVLLLSACGGGGGSSDSPEATPTPEPTPEVTPTPEPNGPVDDITAFGDHVHPIAVDNCAGCHAEGGIGGIAFADQNIETAFNVVDTNGLANLGTPSDSALVTTIAGGDHYTITDTSIAATMQSGIEAWAAAVSGGEPTPTPTLAPVQLNANQQAFAETVYPLVEGCQSCHGATENPATAGIDMPKFAHENIAIAYEVTTSREFINRDEPELSRFISRMAVDGHMCGNSCSEKAEDFETAILDFLDRIGYVSGNPEPEPTPIPTPTPTPIPTPVGVDPADALAAFENTFYATITGESCAGCHNGTYAVKITEFANPDAATALDETVNNAVADLDNADLSKIVAEYLRDKQHNCGNSAACGALADKIEASIEQWSALLERGGGDVDGPLAVEDRFETRSGVAIDTDFVTANDANPFGEFLSIVEFDEVSVEGGSVSGEGNGIFTYSPPVGFVGVDTFTYTISDGTNEDTGTVRITVVENDGLFANNDVVQVGENQNAFIATSTLLLNDFVPAGAGTPAIIEVDRSTEEGGVATLNGNQITYEPPRGFQGTTDKFTYTVAAGGEVAFAFVEIDINSQPIALSDQAYTYVNLDVRIDAVTKNDVDFNGDTLTVSSFDTASAQGGEVTFNNDGTFTYEPPQGFEGTDSFEYIISDGRNGASAANVFINVVQENLADDNKFLALLNQTSPRNTQSAETAAAYYAAVDPGNNRTTFDEWAAFTGIDDDVDNFALYINANDLGFTRRMHVRVDDQTGEVISYVANYANIADALVEEGVIATVAMEYTVAPGRDPEDPDEPKFTTFYVFDGNNDRDLGADLDGRGFKFVPGLCNVCHGGAPKTVFNGVYPDFGDTDARWIPWDLETYAFEDATGEVSRADQEFEFRGLNRAILATNPEPQIKELIEGWYGGEGLPADNFADFVPASWRPPLAPASAVQLYQQVVAPYCRACHTLRGFEQQDDIALHSYDQFMTYRDRIEDVVFDESTMPLALVTFDRAFGLNDVAMETLAEALDSNRFLEEEVVLKPGRPIADAGPFREAALGEVVLNANASVFVGSGVDAIQWRLLERPADSDAELEGADSANPSFFADQPGDYVVELIVNDDDATTPPSPPAELVIRVNPVLDQLSFRRDVAPLFEPCSVCHTGLDNNPRFNNDRLLFDAVADFVNHDDYVISKILTKPSGHNHNGGVIPGFESPTAEGYRTVLRWIQEGGLDN